MRLLSMEVMISLATLLWVKLVNLSSRPSMSKITQPSTPISFYLPFYMPESSSISREKAWALIDLEKGLKMRKFSKCYTI